jgi:DNA-directed RNA polymerase subunit RPC12/RpoP
VIRFKCIYCGQRILAPDDGADKKGKCPKCNHLLVVPLTTKGRPAISPNKEPPPDRSKPSVPAWDKAPDFWFKDPRSRFIESPDALVNLCKEEFSFLIPTYDELSLFLISVTMIIFYLANSRMRNQINTFFAKAADIGAWGLFVPLVLLLATIGLCIYHAFATREKTMFEKRVMMGFAVLTNFIAGTIAAVYALKGTVASNWLLVFPIWNIINGVLMLLMVSLGIIDEECISDRDANTTEVIIGLIAVLIIFALCNYAFKLHWAITFSICIIYTTSFDRALQSIFPRLSSQSDE